MPFCIIGTDEWTVSDECIGGFSDACIKAVYNYSGKAYTIYNCASNLTCQMSSYAGVPSNNYCCYKINCNSSRSSSKNSNIIIQYLFFTLQIFIFILY